MVNTLTLFPQLPPLSFEQVQAIFTAANVPLAAQASLAGVSRQSIWLRKIGKRGSGAYTLDRLASVAFTVIAWQVKTGVTQFPPRARTKQVREALACVTAADVQALDINAVLTRVLGVEHAA